MKLTIVINGSGGVGKDTLCNMAAKHFRVRNISSIDPIKALAKQCGWSGEKDDRARRFLSDLKALTVAYNDFPYNWIMEQYREFLSSTDELLFVHIREPEEIAKFVQGTDNRAYTLLIRGGERFQARRKGVYGNVSDDGVEQYDYDYVYCNDKPLSLVEEDFQRFLEKIVLQQVKYGGKSERNSK